MKKRMIALILALITSVSLSTVAAAAEPVQTVSNPIRISAQNEISPYADIIETKYRIYNGELQKRRWNRTRGVWVDANWIFVANAQ